MVINKLNAFRYGWYTCSLTIKVMIEGVPNTLLGYTVTSGQVRVIVCHIYRAVCKHGSLPNVSTAQSCGTSGDGRDSST